jgi:hypothetical protein
MRGTLRFQISKLLVFFLVSGPQYSYQKNFRLSRGVAGVTGGFWMKFEAQLAQPC